MHRPSTWSSPASIDLGQALLFDSIWVRLYVVIEWIITASFVRWYEDPTLVRTYGDE